VDPHPPPETLTATVDGGPAGDEEGDGEAEGDEDGETGAAPVGAGVEQPAANRTAAVASTRRRIPS
jgi:hypothetical protein